ncbi:MAG: hypothetical protein JXP34_16860 [Planctomycetes bacterium]|nr:hypothetical protein [Planctomycetota bacterium]
MGFLDERDGLDERDEYVVAGHGCLQSAAALVPRLRTDGPGAAVELYRIFRTLEGVAGFLRSDAIHRLSHRAETVLRSVAAGSLHISSRHAAILERAIGLLRRRVLDDPSGDETPSESALLDDLDAWLQEDLRGEADDPEVGDA